MERDLMRGPWFITPNAIRDYLRIRGWVDDEANVETARNDLIKCAREIVASGKRGVLTEQGYLRYRTGRARGRMQLIVSPVPRVEGELPQLVGVARSMH